MEQVEQARSVVRAARRSLAEAEKLARKAKIVTCQDRDDLRAIARRLAQEARQLTAAASDMIASRGKVG